MSTSSNVAATTRKLFEQNNDSIETMSNGQKRGGVMVVSSQKKAKGKAVTSPRPLFWHGFHTLNTIACKNGESIEPTQFVSELVKDEMTHEGMTLQPHPSPV